MSSAGAIEAGSVYAILQSAAMGGYGVAAVGGAVQGVAVGAGVLHGLKKPGPVTITISTPVAFTVKISVVEYYH